MKFLTNDATINRTTRFAYRKPIHQNFQFIESMEKYGKNGTFFSPIQFRFPKPNGINECDCLAATLSDRKLFGSNLLAFRPQIDVLRCKSNMDRTNSVPLGILYSPWDEINCILFRRKKVSIKCLPIFRSDLVIRVNSGIIGNRRRVSFMKQSVWMS